MGTEYSKIGSVSYGEIVEVLDDSNAGWAKLKLQAVWKVMSQKTILERSGGNNVK